MSKCYTIKPLDFKYEAEYGYMVLFESWTAKSPIGNFQISNLPLHQYGKKFDLLLQSSDGSDCDHIGYFGNLEDAEETANDYFRAMLEPYLDEAGF